MTDEDWKARAERAEAALVTLRDEALKRTLPPPGRAIGGDAISATWVMLTARAGLGG